MSNKIPSMSQRPHNHEPKIMRAKAKQAPMCSISASATKLKGRRHPARPLRINLGRRSHIVSQCFDDLGCRSHCISQCDGNLGRCSHNIPQCFSNLGHRLQCVSRSFGILGRSFQRVLLCFSNYNLVALSRQPASRPVSQPASPLA